MAAASSKVNKKKRKTNPNKVNQYTGPDPRQALFLSLYLDPKSETWSNAYQSCIAAGYSQEYAEVMKAQQPAWLSESLREMNRVSMIGKVDRNLHEFLDLDTNTQAMGAFGPIVDKKTKKPIMVVNAKLLAIKEKATEFVAETVGKAVYGKPDQGKAPIIPIQINNSISLDKEVYQ